MTTAGNSNNNTMTSVNTSEAILQIFGTAKVLTSTAITLMVIVAVTGNTAVILSVFIYRRMRTFTNMLLVSLASADLFVGLLIMPPAMITVVKEGKWHFGLTSCKIFLTMDVLLCTASILNLCVISLDRYVAILWPLRYIRQRTRELAIGLISGVWVLSALISAPPWFVPYWGFSKQNETCEYVDNISYRIYSAFGSFYIPLFVMLFVYYKILRVANSRERLLLEGDHRAKPSSVRSNNLHLSTKSKGAMKLNRLMSERRLSPSSSPNEPRKGSAPSRPKTWSKKSLLSVHRQVVNHQTVIEPEPDPETTIWNDNRVMEESIVDQASLSDLSRDEDTQTPRSSRRFNAKTSYESSSRRVTTWDKSPPSSLVNQARKYYTNAKPLKSKREKSIYLRERKALKTIAIIVIGFICCWLPFFMLYLLEGATGTTKVPDLVQQLFLWLGYSNSLVNPLIYTFYNQDFRRCFRDLLRCGCCKHQANRRLSVRQLHTRVA